MLMIDTAAYATYAPCNVLDLLVAKLPSVRSKAQLPPRLPLTPTPYSYTYPYPYPNPYPQSYPYPKP